MTYSLTIVSPPWFKDLPRSWSCCFIYHHEINWNLLRIWFSKMSQGAIALGPNHFQMGVFFKNNTCIHILSIDKLSWPLSCFAFVCKISTIRYISHLDCHRRTNWLCGRCLWKKQIKTETKVNQAQDCFSRRQIPSLPFKLFKLMTRMCES